MQAVFLFASLYLNTIVQENKPDKCMSHGWCFKSQGNEIFKC